MACGRSFFLARQQCGRAGILLAFENFFLWLLSFRISPYITIGVCIDRDAFWKVRTIVSMRSDSPIYVLSQGNR